jgi:5-methylcytosine-specific restriction endonuclease McrA
VDRQIIIEDIAERVQRAVVALLAGDVESARATLASIDRARIVEERAAARNRIRAPGAIASRAKPHQPNMKRDSVAGKRALDLFKRDSFTCRYAHCRRRTIYLPIFKALSRALPDQQPYQSNWKPLESHILLWTYSSSVEHHVAFAHGGTSAEDNLITTCYQCNDLKNCLTAEDLGWEIAPRVPSTWDGLSSQITALKSVGYL